MKAYLLSFFLLIVLLSCNSEPDNKSLESALSATDTSRQITRDLSAAEFKAKLTQANVQLLDVRTPEEWERGVIGEPVKSNIRSLRFEEEVEALDRQRPVLVYCAAGGRSSRAMKLLGEKGFTEVYNLSGGIGAWKSAGYSLEGN